MTPPIGYIAYIDEAGDTGLKHIRTKDEAGASEWLVLSAFVVRQRKEGQVTNWTRKIIADLDQHQVLQLHFRELTGPKKILVCKQIAALDARLFVFLSHKRNMQNYRNLNAEKAKVNKTAWFYVWCSKVLLESVTDFCARLSERDFRKPRTVQFEFSQTGGVKLEDVRAYYKYIKEQAALGLLYNKEFPLRWEVLDPEQMFIYPNAQRYGLQLADVVASAFYAALEYPDSGLLNPEYAKTLRPRLCQSERGKISMYGVKTMPRAIAFSLPADQREILDFYDNQ